MSFAEMKEMLPSLTEEERSGLLECLCALEEGVSVEEYRKIKAVIEEALNDPAPGYTVEEVRADLAKLGRGDAAAA